MAMNEYRRHAAACLSIADEITTDPKNKMLLIAMAQAWLKLAQRVEIDLATGSVSEVPSAHSDTVVP